MRILEVLMRRFAVLEQWIGTITPDWGNVALSLFIPTVTRISPRVIPSPFPQINKSGLYNYFTNSGKRKNPLKRNHNKEKTNFPGTQGTIRLPPQTTRQPGTISLHLRFIIYNSRFLKKYIVLSFAKKILVFLIVFKI